MTSHRGFRSNRFNHPSFLPSPPVLVCLVWLCGVWLRQSPLAEILQLTRESHAGVSIATQRRGCGSKGALVDDGAYPRRRATTSRKGPRGVGEQCPSLMAAHAAALACFVVAAAGAPAPPKLYVCQDRQCVQSASGLPLSECEAACAPPPNANYTCSGGQCVVSARGLPKALCTQVCGGPGPAPPPAGKTIVDLAAATPDLSTLVVALKAGGLVGTLSGQGPFTVFAPTNEAFAALPAGTVTKLLKPENKVQLDDILTYHVVAGDIHAKDLKDQETVTTLEGKDLIVRVDGDGTVFINSAKVITADVNASNGVVHIIDRVLIPAGPAPSPGPPGPGPPPPGPGPTGCTKAGCVFSFTWEKGAFNRPARFGGRCGEVDAAPRMPDDIWDDPKAVAAYVEATKSAYFDNKFRVPTIYQKPCEHNRAWVQNGTQQIEWLGDKEDGFGAFCAKRCRCTIPGASGKKHGAGLPPCTDAPDSPPKYCSLCGPKLNAPIEVYFYYPTGLPPPPPPCAGGNCNIVELVSMNTQGTPCSKSL